MKKIETSVFASGLLCFKAFFEGILSLSDRNCTINSVFVIEGRKEMALNLTKENFIMVFMSAVQLQQFGANVLRWKSVV